MEKFELIVLFVLAFLFSCQDKSKTNVIATNNSSSEQYNTNDSLENILYINTNYLSDSLLKDKTGVLKKYLDKYQTDSCGIRTYTNEELKENFEGINTVQSIKNHSKFDTVFVMPPFNNCDPGESYCFFDKSLPRLLTDSHCCQPNNLFVVDDIDEDGVREIGIYYSSCTSRYKALMIYKLKENSWQEIGASTFDVLTQDPTKVIFSKLVKKQGKNRFQICNFEDGQTKWETITL